MRIKLAPFDLKRAKAGSEVVTRKGLPVKIIYDRAAGKYPIVGLVHYSKDFEMPMRFNLNGESDWGGIEMDEHDLFLTEEIESPFMTKQELSDWLRDAPEEHREFRYADSDKVYSTYDYPKSDANIPEEGVLIRRNHGKWMKPLVEL